MKHFRVKIPFLSVLFLATLLVFTSGAYASTGRQLAESAISSLKAQASTTTEVNMITLGWTWTELNFYDETYPLTIDLLGSNFLTARKVVYLLPGGGVNFQSSFLTPLDNNLAQYLRKAGYLVIGITPREDKVPADAPYSCMIPWGLDKHTDDVRKIVNIVQGKLGLPYRILGHSFGAAYALDYASHYSSDILLEKIIALDIYSFDPGDAQSRYASWLSYTAFDTLMGQGTYADASYTDIKSLMLISLILPFVDSGTSRADMGYPGNFTFEGLLYFAMIHSNLMPGIHTPITGLPGDWPLVQSYAYGDYHFSQIPLFDTYSLKKSDMCTLREAGFKVGSGLVPCALYRDFFALNAYDGSYNLDWAGIQKPLLWVNTEWGYGQNQYGVTFIHNSGNSQVVSKVISGYGHLDALSGRTAKDDVWYLFLQ